MNPDLQRRCLLSLAAFSEPMPEDALVAAMQVNMRPRPTISDCDAVIRWLEKLKFIQGVTDEMTQSATWSLLEKGKHKARELQ